MLTILATLGAGGAWYDARQDGEHNVLTASAVAGDVELDLKLVEVELKMYRAIQERRELTADELDRIEYLKQRREILLQEQRKQ